MVFLQSLPAGFSVLVLWLHYAAGLSKCA